MLNSPWIRKPDFKNIRSLDYDVYWDERGFQIAKELKPREKIMLDRIPKGASVLDIGCGNSGLPLELKKKGAVVRVADVSSRVVDEYKKEGIEGEIINIEETASIKLKQRYDYIILSEVLEHTRNPEEVILALKPFAKRFLITVPNSAAYVFRYGLLVRGRFFTQWVMHPSEHLRFWSHIDFLDWLDALGLKVEAMTPSDGFTLRGLLPFLPRLWKNLLAYRIVYECSIKGADVKP